MNKKLHFKIKPLKFLQCLLLCGLLTGLFSQSHANPTKSETEFMQQIPTITLNMQNKPLIAILFEIQKQAKINFLYNDEELKTFPNKSVNVSKATLESVLNQLFDGSDYTYRIRENNITIVKKAIQSKSTTKNSMVVSGSVVDENKKAVVGATVLIPGTTKGAITDEKGHFSMEVNDGATLNVSFVGKIEQNYTVKPGEGAIIVELKSAAMDVEDVVVTGYFNRNKSSYTGNAVAYTGKELTQVSSSNVLATLSMLDPSFKMNINNEFGSDPNRIPDFQIQGSTNLQNEYSETPNMPTFILDGFEVTSQKIFDLDPNRVKSITILKDASATAIYGSRAANGVVVVETYPPLEGTIKVTYSFNGDFSAADLTSYDLMNAAEKLEYERLAKLFIQPNGYAPAQERLDQIYNSRWSAVQKGIDTDWITKPIRALAFSHKHAVNVEGGSESFRYALNLNYRGVNGAMLGSGRDNVGIGVKLQYQKNKIKFVNDITFDNTSVTNSPYGSFQSYTMMNPYYYPYDENGNVIKLMYKATNIDEKNIYNPLYNATVNTKDTQDISDFAEKFSFEWDMAKGLKFRANASIEKNNTNSDDFKPNAHTSFAPAKQTETEEERTRPKGSYRKGNSVRVAYDINSSLTYNTLINKHMINLAAVYNVREDNTNSDVYTAYNFPNDNFDHVSMSTMFREGDRPGGSTDIKRLMGVAFNANYGFDNRFFADFSLRSDASSVFGSNKRWGTFYSVGAAWNLHHEKFLKDNNIVSNLKIRTSYGTTGGQNFNPYQAMMMYSYKDSAIDGTSYNGKIGALVMAYGNPDLKWQLTEKFNVGVDFALFNNRLSGYFNYYSNKTIDKLIDLSLAPSTGFSTYTENLGNVNNSGVEFNIKGTIIKNIKSDFRVDAFFNIVANKNKLVNVNNALSAYNDGQYAKREENEENRPVVKYIEGQSINTIWVNESLGIDPATGDEVFIDLNGRRVNKYDVRNDKPFASKDADFEGRFGAIFSYKGFTLNALFAYSYGGYIYNETLVNKIENVSPQNNGDRRILYDRWSKPGDVAKYKNISKTDRTKPTSRFVEIENYVNLASLNLSYQFQPETLKKYGIEMLRITAIGNDLFRASTVRMERGIAYPFARTFTLNLQLTF